MPSDSNVLLHLPGNSFVMVVTKTAVVLTGKEVMLLSYLNYLDPTLVQNPYRVKQKCIHSRQKNGEKKLKCLILDHW